MGRSYKEITPPQWEEEEDRIISEQIIGRGYSDVYEKEFIRKDGTIISVELRAYLLKDNSENVGMWGIARDITERKRMEAALREESEEKYRVLIENAGEAIFVTQEGKLKSVNAKTEELLGYTKEELTSRPFTDFIHPDDRAPALDRYFKSPQGREVPSRYSFRVVHRSGETLWTELNAVLIEWDGKPAALNFLSDITDLKHKEEEKRILEERLQHAAKMESVGTLAGGIAHDFNNLLMGIQGDVSLMLLDFDPSHPDYEKLKRIEEQVETGALLTKQLLGFSRGGRYEVKPTNMNDIIDKTSSMFGRTKKEIAVSRSLAGDLWVVDVDRGQMEQVFMNLYVNAWQAMPAGGEIFLGTENILLDEAQAIPYAVKAGKYVKITITDTGMGMDEETKKRIFDPFFTTKAMGRGTGLGLAMVYGIIKGHKGAINVNSVPGHGATFNIYLPVSERIVVKEQAVPEEIVKGTGTILVSDDEELILKVSRKMLEFLGYRVYTAKSGQEAIAVYMEKRNEIDLVILDMIMPGISGGETFDRLREINSGIKVLLSSGYSISGQAQEILNRGCNGFIQKPFSLEKISRKVREMLD
jgi:PAS domain S-box-containing protein